MTKIAGSGSGSISQRHGSADSDPDPDPPQNVMDPQHCFEACGFSVVFALVRGFSRHREDNFGMLITGAGSSWTASWFCLPNHGPVVRGEQKVTKIVRIVLRVISWHDIGSAGVGAILSRLNRDTIGEPHSLTTSPRTCQPSTLWNEEHKYDITCTFLWFSLPCTLAYSFSQTATSKKSSPRSNKTCQKILQPENSTEPKLPKGPRLILSWCASTKFKC